MSGLRQKQIRKRQLSRLIGWLQWRRCRDFLQTLEGHVQCWECCCASNCSVHDVVLRCMVMQCWEALLFCTVINVYIVLPCRRPDSPSFCSSVWLRRDCSCLHSCLALPLVWDATCPDTFARLTCSWLPQKQVQWQTRPSEGKGSNTLS